MNIIKTNQCEWLDDNICPICHEPFKETDDLLLVKHYESLASKKPEQMKTSRRRKHMFHHACMQLYLNTVHDHVVVTCPLDRERIHGLVGVKYYEIVALNIINFSSNYYELLDKCQMNKRVFISVIDHINLNYKDAYGKTLLYCACQRGELSLVQRIVKAGGHPQIADNNGFTPLMASVCHNYLDIVKYLISRPEVAQGINTTDKRGLSALSHAYETHHYDCIRALLRLKGLDTPTLSNILKNIQYRNEKTMGLIDLVNVIKKYLGIQTQLIADQPPFVFKPQPSKPRITHHDHDQPTPSDCELYDTSPYLFQSVYGAREPSHAHDNVVVPFGDEEIRDMTSRPHKTPDFQEELIIYKELGVK